METLNQCTVVKSVKTGNKSYKIIVKTNQKSLEFELLNGGCLRVKEFLMKLEKEPINEKEKVLSCVNQAITIFNKLFKV